ncbi:hypothetical protein ACHQM5_016836 [Ranunculus cassubicifolius]
MDLTTFSTLKLNIMDQERDQLEDMTDIEEFLQESSKGARGLTLATRSDDGVKYFIEFNSKGQITPKSIRNKVVKWQGTLAKLLVPLSTYEKWTSVCKKLKKIIWERFLKKFEVDSKYRKKCLQAIGVCWKNWKHRLTMKCILPFKDDPELLKTPPYRFIKPNDWSLFVKSRLSEKFQELRDVQAKRRKTNKYDHRLSRKGYVGLQEEIEKEFGPSYEVDRSEMWLLARQDSNGQFLNDSTREIAEKIKQVRKDVKDGIVSVEGKNDVLTLSLGTSEHNGRVRGAGKNFTPTNYFDIPRRVSKKKELEAENMDLKAKIKMYESLLLEKGIESPHLENVASNSAKSDNGKRKATSFDDEHSCGMTNKRSRGFVLETSNTKCKQLSNGDKASSKKSRAKSQFPKATVGDHCLEPMMFGNQDICGTNNRRPVANIKKYEKPKDGARVTTTKQFSKPHQSNGQVQECSLALGSKNNIVAKGSVFPKMGPDERLHTVPLGEENLRVSIAYPIQKTALLPIPFDEYTTVGSAMGVPLAWPKEFVIIEKANMEENCGNNDYDGRGFETNEVPQEARKEDKIDKETFNEFANLVKRIETIEELYPMDTGVFERETQFFISKGEVLDVCNFKHQSVSCIIAYIGYLHETYESSRQSYGFCYPADASQFGRKDPKKKNHYLPKKNEFPTIIKERLRNRHANQAIFIPYNTGIHWVLAMIDINANEIYYFNSLRESKEPPLGLTVMVQAAMIHLSSDESRRFQLTWKPVQCPKQSEAFECGYYVMQFMKHFIENPDKPIKTKMMELASKKAYTHGELAKTRLELITFIMSWITT